MAAKHSRLYLELSQPDYQGSEAAGRNHLLLIANGYIGIRGCFAEFFDDQSASSIHCVGIYDQAAYDDPTKDLWKEIINFPDFMSAPMVFDGEPVWIRCEGDNVQDFSASLNLKTAILTLKYLWRSRKGHSLKVEINRFCSYHNHNLIYNSISLTSLDIDAEIKYNAGIDGAYIDTYLRREIEAALQERIGREIDYGLVKQEDRDIRLRQELDAEVARVKKSQVFIMSYRIGKKSYKGCISCSPTRKTGSSSSMTATSIWRISALRRSKAGSSATNTWVQRYEGKSAALSGTGTASADRYPRGSGQSASNGRYITFTQASTATATFTGTVPVDGSYRMDLVAGSGYTGTASNQNGTGRSP